MLERMLDSLERLAVGLRVAHQAERCVAKALAVHIWGFEEIVKDTPLRVGIYWNADRTDMMLEGSGLGRIPALALCAACVAYETERRRTCTPTLAT